MSKKVITRLDDNALRDERRIPKKSLPQLHNDSFKSEKSKTNFSVGEMPSEVKVDVLKHKDRRNTHNVVVYPSEMAVVPKMSSRSSDYVYVNAAYVGSTSSVHQPRQQVTLAPPTSVVREQYWACSKWPAGQRVLAIAVGVLVGTVIGLALTVAIRGKIDEDLIPGFFKSSAPD